MKPSKSGNAVGSTTKSTAKCTFVAPGSIGAIGNELGRERRSSTIGRDEKIAKISYVSSSDIVNQCIKEYEATKGREQESNSMVLEKEQMPTKTSFPSSSAPKSKGMEQGFKSLPTKIVFPPPTGQVKQYTQADESTIVGKGRGQGLRSLIKKEPKPISFSSTISQVEQYTEIVEAEASINSKRCGKGSGSIVLERENLATKFSIPPNPVEQSRKVESSSSTIKKVKQVRGRNKCKEVALLEVGEKLKVTFYNNRTVGEKSNLFSRHLGKLARDRNVCPLGVSSWNDISEEKLNHIFAAVEDKFESDNLDLRRDDILAWVKELWNKYRGDLHRKYAKGKPILEALKKKPRGVDKKDSEWLVQEHFR